MLDESQKLIANVLKSKIETPTSFCPTEISQLQNSLDFLTSKVIADQKQLKPFQFDYHYAYYN